MPFACRSPRLPWRRRKSADGIARWSTPNAGFPQPPSSWGWRAAFRTILERQAVLFRPGPVNGWDAVAQQPDDEATLEWAPAGAELSLAGDLGLTVGVWRRTAPDGARTYGRYVTLWRRTIEGSWRVAADIGVSAPSEIAWPTDVDAGRLASRTAARDLSKDALDASLDALRTADRASASDAGRAHPAVVAYRNGRPLVSGRDAVVNLARTEQIVREQVDAAAARSGDLGYTYGSARVTGGASAGYLRVWACRPGAAWEVLIDVVTAG